MEVTKYLERIKYREPLHITYKVLAELQAQHLLHVPFENLDIHAHVKIDLDNLYHKIVTCNRGGFCYELNGLFYQLLLAIGFSVKMVSARVYLGNRQYGPEFDHMALIVNISNEQYLADVGFGDFSFHPLQVIFQQDLQDTAGVFRMEPYERDYIAVMKKNIQGKFVPQYIFSTVERCLAGFSGMCHYHQTSEKSHFTQKRICSLFTRTGRITLTGNKLKITDNGMVTEKELMNGHEVQEVLREFFSIKL